MVTRKEALANKIRVQAEGVQSWVDYGYRSCLEWATGVGKSKAAIDCMKLYETTNTLPILLLTPTEKMRDEDWPEEFKKWNYIPRSIKIVCYAVAAKADFSKYGMIVFDEMHKLTAHNLKRLTDDPFQKLLGLTATRYNRNYSDEDRERVLLSEELLPTSHRVTTDEAVDLGLIADFEIYVVKYFLEGVKKTILAGNAKAPFYQTEVEKYKFLTKKLQFAMMKAKDKKFEFMKFSAMSARTQFIYNLPSKLVMAKHFLERLQKEPGKRTLIFAGSVEQANLLCDHVYHSDSTSESLDKFQRAEIDTIASVRCLNEGANLHKPDQNLIVQVDSVDRNLVQRIGRCVRIRYDELDFKARIVILVALNTCDEEWYKKAIAGFDSKRITERTLAKIPYDE